MPEHGGNLARAARDYGIAEERWLDLSTGINPSGYPVPSIPAREWQCLPGEPAALQRIAADYYQADQLLPVAGTQAAIQALPRLRPLSRVTLAALTYNEYAHAWQRQGHAVSTARPEEFDAKIEQTDVLIVCNPNNPTGETIARERLLGWHEALAERGGWLVVDEAYIDVTPDESLAVHACKPGLIVLRSLGKFFGLAGARVGFVLADSLLLSALQAELGPWTVSGPAQIAARQALADRAWQAQARADLLLASRRLHDLLARNGIAAHGPALFQWWQHAQATAMHRRLATEAILTRRFQGVQPCGIRFGLPGAVGEWQRLALALAQPIEKQ